MHALPPFGEIHDLWRACHVAHAAHDRPALERLLATARAGAREAEPGERQDWELLVDGIKSAQADLRGPSRVLEYQRGVIYTLLVELLVSLVVTGARYTVAPEGDFHAPEPTLERRAAPGAAYGSLPGGTVYVVPLGSLDRRSVEQRVGSIGPQMGVQLVVTPRVSMAHIRPTRDGQLPPWDVVYTLRGRPPDPWSAVIGVTELDLAGGVPGDRFTFSASDLKIGAGVISLGRLDPANYGRRSDERLLRRRFRKMLVRSVGFLYFRSPSSPDPSSPLRDSIRSLDGVDAISPDVPRWGRAP